MDMGTRLRSECEELPCRPIEQVSSFLPLSFQASVERKSRVENPSINSVKAISRTSKIIPRHISKNQYHEQKKEKKNKAQTGYRRTLLNNQAYVGI